MDEFNEAVEFEAAVDLAGDFPTMPVDELMRRALAAQRREG